MSLVTLLIRLSRALYPISSKNMSTAALCFVLKVSERHCFKRARTARLFHKLFITSQPLSPLEPAFHATCPIFALLGPPTPMLSLGKDLSRCTHQRLSQTIYVTAATPFLHIVSSQARFPAPWWEVLSYFHSQCRTKCLGNKDLDLWELIDE